MLNNNIKPGDEIIVPALGFIATANAVRAAGFTPVFVDVKCETLNIDTDKIAEAITPKTVAIIAVHTMGKPCNMDPICNIAEKHKLFIIEDACEAHGAKYNHKYVGHDSHMICFSYYIAHLVCCGEGGMVCTKYGAIAEALLSTKSHGRRNGLYFDHNKFGLNSKMNDLEASVGLGDILDFHETFRKRRANVQTIRRYVKGFEDIAWFSEEDLNDLNCPHGFSITLKQVNKLQVLTDALDKERIHWKRNFGCVPTQHEAFSYLGHKLGDFPNAEHIGNNGIHIGVHKYLSDNDLQRIGETLYEALKEINDDTI